MSKERSGYCVACGEFMVEHQKDVIVCLDCYALAERQGRIADDGMPIVLDHYCYVCGAAIGDVQNVPIGERIWCERHRKDR